MSLDLHVSSVVDSLFDFLERAPAAILLLDGQRRVVYANSEATAATARNDGICLAGGTFALLRQQDDARFQELIVRALGAGHAPPSAMRATRAPGRRPYAIVVTRLSAHLAVPERMRPALCVVISDPDTRRDVPVDRLQALFGLTEAEGRLAALLACGDDLKSAARTLDITYGTARARLAEVFSKTDTRRQGELVNLVLTTLAIV